MAQIFIPPVTRTAPQNDLNGLIQGLQAGQALAALPQQQAQAAAAQELNQLLTAAKIQELQQGKLMEVGGSIVRVNPQTGQPEVVFGGPRAATPVNFQPIGMTKEGQFVSFDPRNNALIPTQNPQGITLEGGLLPKTQPSETQTLIGTQNGGFAQFGNRGSGVTTANVGTGINPNAPVLPTVQQRKNVLAINEKTGKVTNIALSPDEALPDGFKQATKGTSDFKNIQSLRKEVSSNPVVKQFTDVQKSKQRIDLAMEEAKNSNNFVVVDQALISSFNRLLEPDSVTMVSEYARTSSDAPLINQIRNSITAITKGGKLGSEERAALSRLSDAIYNTSLGNYSRTIDFYEDISERNGFNINDVIQPLTDRSTNPLQSSANAPSGSTAAPAQGGSLLERLRAKYPVK